MVVDEPPHDHQGDTTMATAPARSASAYVKAKPAPLGRAIRAAGFSTRGLETATDKAVSKATVSNLLTLPGYSISRDKAEAIARALGRPVGELFVHHDDQPLGVSL